MPDGSGRGRVPLSDTRLAQRLRKETKAKLLFSRGNQGGTLPTPQFTRSSPWA